MIRKLECNEFAEYRALWCEVFGDEPEFVDKLYASTGAVAYAAWDGGVLHSFLTLFRAGVITGAYGSNECCGDAEGLPVMVSYAICTRPESRGRGYGSELVRYVRKLVTANGGVSLVCPAESGLEEFYAGLGYVPVFCASERNAEAEDIKVRTSVLSVTEYNRFREAFLADIPHVQFGLNLIDFIRRDSNDAQGLLLVNNGDAICTINRCEDNELVISELVVNPVLTAINSEIAEQLAGGLAKLFNARIARFRSIAQIVYTDDDGDHLSEGCYIQGMACGVTIDPHEAAVLPYYGFPID